jgi:hypothetical protein
MIVAENNPYKEERDKIRKTFQMLSGVRLPKHFYFVDDCVQIRRITWRGLNNVKIADIYLKKDALKVEFVDEEEFNRLRGCFVDSETKFELCVGTYYS